MKIENHKKTTVIVCPTYNEANSIGKMIDHLFTITFPKIKDWNCIFMVVDGNSPDGTSQVVTDKQKQFKNLDLLTETKKEGIGAAYVKGFRRALSVHKADVVIEMDGDFQHPPKTIPVMLRAIDEGSDYVLTSRKIKGGSNPKGWGFKRLFLSEVGGLTARFVLFFPTKNFFKITDPTTGYKASRVKGFVDTMDMDNLYSRSFAYKLEFLYKMISLGAKVSEVPLNFGLRDGGESKITTNTPTDILRTVILLRFNDPTTQKLLKFGIVGGFGFFVNIFGAIIFKKMLITPTSNISLLNTLANALGAELAIISNFIWNNLWTFAKEKIKSQAELVSKFVTFNLSSVVTGIVIPSICIFLLTNLFGDHLMIYQVLAIFGLTIPLNWFIYNTFIWKK